MNKVNNAVVENPVNAAIDALRSGKDVEQAVYGTSTPAPSVEPTSKEGFDVDKFLSGEEGAPVSEESDNQKDLPSTLDEVVDSSSSSESAPEKKGDIEEILINEEGGRKKITVDWSDREKLKKYVHMAAGMRKFQAERDQVMGKLSQIEPEYKELKSSWEALENAFSQGGVKGLVNLLSGDQAGYEKHIQSEFARLKARETATPSELEKMDLEERLSIERRERERLTKQVEESLKRSQEEREQASIKSLEAQVHPAFDKYRFAGKLGDEVVEQRLDKAIWDQALRNLEEYPDNVELSSSLIDKEFREVSNSFRKIINKQAEQKAKKVVASKKVAAQESAATKAMNGYIANSASNAEKFKGDIRKGDFTSALRDLMTGKFKL